MLCINRFVSNDSLIGESDPSFQNIPLDHGDISCMYYHQQQHIVLIANRQSLITVYCTRTFQKLAQFLLVHHQKHGHPVHFTSFAETAVVFALLSDNSIYSIDLNVLLQRAATAATELCYRYLVNVSLPTFKILALPTASGRK